MKFKITTLLLLFMTLCTGLLTAQVPPMNQQMPDLPTSADVSDEEWRTTGRQGKMNSSEERSVSLDIELENLSEEEKPAEKRNLRNMVNQ